MGSCELTDDEKKLLKFVCEADINDVKQFLNDVRPSINCIDDQGMTPLQHAAFKGKYEVCKLLLDCGADVNANHHIYGYSALCLAALSNHYDVIILLLESGADVTVINSNKRTASQMAAFVGNYKAVSIINNYSPKSLIDYFTEVQSLDKESKLSMLLSEPLHKLVILPNIHPVRLVLYFQSCSLILQHVSRVIDVLKILSEKQLKEMSNERFSLKFHHIGFVLFAVYDFIKKQQNKCPSKEKSDEEMLEILIKIWIKDSSSNGISLVLEKFLRKDILAYPFKDSLLFQQILHSLSVTEVGNESSALSLLSNSISGQYLPYDLEYCATCGELGAEKKCSTCKAVQYCNKTCQKLHWFIHKSVCKQLNTYNA